MKNFTEIKYFLLCSIIFLLLSCGKEDEVPEIDQKSPSVSIANLEDKELVKNVVEISIEATDENGLEKLEVYIDDELVSTFTSEPFSYSWNTNEVEEGLHTVKIKAIDISGNESTYTLELNVRNILLNVEVPEQYVEENETRYLFISDNSGKIIASSELINGQDIEFRNPLFKGDELSLTEVNIYELSSYKEVFMRTFTEVGQGKWVLSIPNEEDNSNVGEAHVTFKDIPEDYSFELISNGTSSGISYYDGDYSKTFNLVKNPSKLLIIKNSIETGQPEKYKLLSNIQVGNANTEVSLDNIDLPLSLKNIELPENVSGYIDLYGLLKAGDLSEMYEITHYLSSGNNLLYYPGEAFAGFYSSSYYESDHVLFESMGFGIENFKNPAYAMDASLDNNTLNFSSTGDFTLCYFAIAPEGDTGEDYFSWSISTPAGKNKSFVIPEIPEVISEKLGENISFTSFNSYGFIDIKSYEKYEGLIPAIANGTTSFDKLIDFGSEFSIWQYNQAKEENSISKIEKKRHIFIRKRK